MNLGTEAMILDQLRSDICTGKYSADQKLPSENRLAELYGIPRIAVRRVFEKLEEMGYIYSQRGKGRFLRQPHGQIELVLSGNESFSHKMLEKGYSFQSKNLFCKKISYNSRIFRELRAKQADQVYKIGRLRIIEQRPIALHISYVPQSVFADIEEKGREIVSMFTYYRSKGYQTFASDKSILRVSLPSLQEQKILKCPPLVPLLILETNCIDPMGEKILEYTEIVYRGDAFQYIVKEAKQ